MTKHAPRIPRRRRRLIPAALTVVGLTLTVPAVAAADSIVYVKDGNVWLAKPDGSSQYQVTRDGTPAQPYRSPSQADDGTIAASFGPEIVRMRQNGSVVNRMDPPPLINSVGSPVDGVPGAVAISPDGTRIVYSLVSYECPIGVPGCGARPVTAITPADRMEPSGRLFTYDSSWVTNTRILTFAGYDHQVNTYDVGQPSDVHWFDDHELVGDEGSTDQSDGEVNRQGTYVATVRGYGDQRSIMWLRIRGNAQTGSRADGSLQLPDVEQGCVTGTASEIGGPSWSPSGTSLAWYEQGDIHVWDDTGACVGTSSRPVIRGAGEPDWGPADVNPGPREDEAVPGPPPGTNPAPAPKSTASKSKGKPALKLATNVRLRTALKRGIRVRVSRGTPGTVKLVARHGKKRVATGKGTLSAKGTATVTLRFTATAKRTLAQRKRITLKLSGAGTTTTLTIKR